MNAVAAMQQYRQVSNHTSVEDANPHKLILMLLMGAQDRITTAKIAMQNKKVQEKAENITSAMKIIDGLKISLDHEKGGDIAKNLDALYEYMGRRLFDANLHNETAILDEVSSLLKEITAGWAGIADKI